ncbi:MAG: hypothetical protein MJ016_03515 [Victivallaceae bacterium]|nr:hypothetical protein [Victivallaceae bacterium]
MSEENEKTTAGNNEAVNQEAVNQEAVNQEAVNQEAANQEAANEKAANQEAAMCSITPFLIIFVVLCVLHWTNVIHWSWWGVAFSSIGFAYLFGCLVTTWECPKYKNSLDGNFLLAAILTCCILKWTDIISWSWWAVIVFPFSLGRAFCSLSGIYGPEDFTVHPDGSIEFPDGLVKRPDGTWYDPDLIFSEKFQRRFQRGTRIVNFTMLFGFFLPFCILKWTGTISLSWWWSIAVVLVGHLVAHWLTEAFQENEAIENTPDRRVEMLRLSDLDEFFGALKTLKSIDDAHATIFFSAPFSEKDQWFIHAEVKSKNHKWINPKYNAMYFHADDIDEDLQKLLQSRENETGSIDLTPRYVERGN